MNLTEIEPDISFCVEVYFIDCKDEFTLIIRDANVTTNYYDAGELNPDYTYKIILTPKSNVDNALPGHSTVLKGTINPHYCTRELIIVML